MTHHKRREHIWSTTPRKQIHNTHSHTWQQTGQALTDAEARLCLAPRRHFCHGLSFGHVDRAPRIFFETSI